MADLKISALTASTTPLAGTEVLPIVQSSTTKQVSVANLTAGRAVSAASLTTTGVVSSAGLIAATTPGLSFAASRWMTQYEGTNTSRTYVCGDDASSYGTWQIYSAKSTGTPIVVCGIDGSFNFNVNSGNVVMGTSGKGIDFAITPGTGTSELLADYEEGTWTPTDGSGAGLSLTVSSATYTKVGRVVTAQAFVTYPSTASVAAAKLSGFPFAPTTSSNYYSPGIVNTTAAVVACLRANSSGQFAFVTANGNADVTNAALSSALVLFSLTYFA